MVGSKPEAKSANADVNPTDGAPSNGLHGTSDRATDFLLLTRAAKGEQAAFRSLVDRHQRRAHAVAFGLVRNPEDAREVVQEAFIRVYRHIDEFEGQASFGTWFYRIVVNLAIDHLRKRAPGGLVELSEDTDIQTSHDDWKVRSTFDPGHALERRRLVDAMQTALDDLPPYHRAVIVLREIDGMSYQEMSEVLDVSKGTIMSRLFHARKKMQVRLRDLLGAENVPEATDETDAADATDATDARDGRDGRDGSDASDKRALSLDRGNGAAVDARRKSKAGPTRGRADGIERVTPPGGVSRG